MADAETGETRRTFSWPALGHWLQYLLDQFYYLRRFIMNCVAYFSMRIYALEVTFKDIKNGKYSTAKHINRNLDAARDLDSLLATAKEQFKLEIDRRNVVTDKCKTLLTLSSFILAINGLFIPKSYQFEGWLFRGLFFLAGLLLLDSVVLLLVYFSVGSDTTIHLDQSLVGLEESDLKKALINEYLLCEVETTNRTNYLVNVYETARFFALSAFTLMLGLVAIDYINHPVTGDAEKAIRQLRSDPQLIDLLRGPKGEKGDKGDRGIKGEKGDMGPRGDKGERGEKGPIGDKGDPTPKVSANRARSVENDVGLTVLNLWPVGRKNRA